MSCPEKTPLLDRLSDEGILPPADPRTAERAAAETLRKDGLLATKPFDVIWGGEPWSKWATIMESLRRLGLMSDARVLDLGVGSGWTSALLAEGGLSVKGIDIAPAHLQTAGERASRWSVDAAFAEGDLEKLDLSETFDAALVFDALHHLDRPELAIKSIAHHLKPGGWLLMGEPSWLHRISPDARRVHRVLGWNEHGMTVRNLKRMCRSAGLSSFRRFYEGTAPYEGRAAGFAWQAMRLAGANFWVAPRAHVWLAVRREPQA